MNNYKLLPALISILQTKNLTESAKILHVTQSAMSKTLSQIREAFHDKILIRDGNQFVLTERGEELKRQLPGLIQSLDSLYLPKTFDYGGCQRQFVFASSDYVAHFILPSICRKMASGAAGASVDYQLWQKSWLRALAQMPIDVITTITDNVPDNLYGRKMAEDIPVMVMGADHPLANKQPTLADYIAAQHIVISGGGEKNTPVDDALQTIHQQRTRFATVPLFLSAIELLLKSDSILTLPLHIAANFSLRHPLCLKPLPIAVKPYHYYILWHAKHQQDPEHRWFRELCYAISKDHLDSTIEYGMNLIQVNQSLI